MVKEGLLYLLLPRNYSCLYLQQIYHDFTIVYYYLIVYLQD